MEAIGTIFFYQLPIEKASKIDEKKRPLLIRNYERPFYSST
jgi:hypothetical protein